MAVITFPFRVTMLSVVALLCSPLYTCGQVYFHVPGLEETNVTEFADIHDWTYLTEGGASASLNQISDRRADLTYDVSVMNSIAGARTRFDNPLTPTIETADVSGLSEIVIGLRDPGEPDFVAVTMVDVDNDLSGVFLAFPDGTEKYYKMLVPDFNVNGVDLDEIKYVDVIIFQEDAHDPTSTLEVRLMGHPFIRLPGSTNFNASAITTLTEMPPVRVGEEENAGSVTSLSFDEDQGLITFVYSLPNDQSRANVIVDRGTVMPVEIADMKAGDVEGVDVMMNVEPGDLYALQKCASLAPGDWVQDVLEFVPNETNFTYCVADPVDDALMFRIASLPRSYQDLSGGMTIGYQCILGSMILSIVDSSDIEATFLLLPGSTAKNFVLDLSDPEKLPLGFDPTQVKEIVLTADAEYIIGTSGTMKVWLGGVSVVGR